MNEHLRAVPGSPGDDAGAHRPTDPPSPDLPPDLHPDLVVERITRSLRAREALAPDPAVVAARLEAQLAARSTAPRSPARVMSGRGARIAAAGLVTSTLAVGGAGAAAAANPYSSMARTVESVVQAVGIDWSAMPSGYTREQYEAFWGAGYEMEDIHALEELWGTDTTETKARTGQMLLDGEQPPVGPGAGAALAGPDQLEAFWDAGYRWEDAVALAELWEVEVGEAKARAAQAIADGEPLPVPPTGPVTEVG